jgi:ATP-dependent DNA helicase RecG
MDATLVERLLRAETERVEWKESPRALDNVLLPVCALANDLGESKEPGYVVYGVKNSGEIVGLNAAGPKLDEMQQQTSSRLTSPAIYPTPSFDLLPLEKDGKTLLVVRVAPQIVPPIVTVDGVAWVRKGTTTRRATSADLSRLQERRPEAALPFDMRVMPLATLDDLEWITLKPEYEAEYADDGTPDSFPTFEEWLTNRLQLGRIHNGLWRPTAGALLLFGKSPQAYFPGAFVEFVRYQGTDIDSPVSWRRTASGTLPTQLDTLWAQVDAHMDQVPAGADGLREPFVPRYPPEVLKELVRNLVQHRLYEGTNAPGRIEWYDDRIEFSNPGGPFGRASDGEFGEHSDYRNPDITKHLVRLGYVQQLGRGIRRANLQLARMGHPPLGVETDGFTRVTVRARS